MEPDTPPSSDAGPEKLDPPPPPSAAGPETLAPPPPSSKHAAMLQRLSDLHSSRLSSTAARHSAAPASESVAAFLARFSAARASIAAALSASSPDLAAAAASIADLDRLLADNSYFLPPYELRSSLSSLADLHHSLDSALPRRKFSFKTRTKNPGTVPEQQSPPPPPHVKKPDYVISDAPGFRNKSAEVLFKQFDSAGGEFTLENLKSCDIYLKGKLRSLFIHRVYDCRVYVGPVLGSTLVDDVEGCLFMLASHQIRIHEARGTDFYLRVRSRPIVEGCSGVRFAEYRFVYGGIEEELRDSGLEEETGNWANVDDFKWLRAVQSPNWSVLPEEERVEAVVATDLEEQGNAD